jgi:uncharacterized protein DUF6968
MIFAERTYRVKDGGEIRFRFYEPTQQDEWRWRCNLEIGWPNGRVTRIPGVGADKLDALLSAVALARTNLVNNEEWRNGNVAWLDTDPWLEVKILD